MVEARTNVAVGDTLPELVRGPIDRATLALFAGAGHDHVRLHIDSDFAHAAGMGDVFAHGMLSMAWLAQMLTHWAPKERLRRGNVRFTAFPPLPPTVTCRGQTGEAFQAAGGRPAGGHNGEGRGRE